MATQDNGQGPQLNVSPIQETGRAIQYATVTNNLPKLDGTNYHSWVEMQGLALEIRGWKEAVTGEMTNPTINAQAKLMLLEAMNESHRAQVRGCSTAKEIMDRLRLIYADRSAANLYRLLHQYYRYSKSPSDSMSEHIGRMDELRCKLADLGEKQSEAVYQVTLIGSLPAEYGTLMELWELTHESMRTTENLVSRLLKREADLKKASDGTQALVASGPRTARSRMSAEEWAEYLKRVTCYNCQDKGHLAKHCKKPRKPKGEGDGGRQPSQDQVAHLSNTEVNFMVDQGGLRLRDKWICDSGASSHMCNDLKWFESIKILKNGELGKCYIGNGKPVSIEGLGTVKVESLVGATWVKTKLSNVQYVPQLSANLISVGQAGEHNVNTTFYKDSCTMSLDGQQVAFGTKLKDGLYLMRMRPTPSKLSTALSVKGDKTLEQYHRALGHASIEKIVTLLKDLGISYRADKDPIECQDCPGGRGRHASHPSVGVRADKPGVIHADLSGIVNKVSIQGFRYYMVCKDELSEFALIYFCKEKKDVPSLIAKMVIDFETVSGHRVSEFHSDNGSEFVNQVTRILFLKERIKHLTSAPFCPQQNGRIEREMQTLTTMARTMLNSSGLPKELWPQALEAAVHIKNRLPTSRTHITPFERLLNRKPTIEHLVCFGEPVHMVINDQYLTKWDCRTTEAFVVGYTNRRNTYQVYIPSRNRVTESCDLYFGKHSTNQSGSQAHPESSEATVRCKSILTDPSVSPGTLSHDKRQDWSTGSQDLQSEGRPLTSTPRPGEQERGTVTGARLQEFFEEFLRDKLTTGGTEGPAYYSCGSDYRERSEHKYQNISESGEGDLIEPSAPVADSEPCSGTCKSLDPHELATSSGGNLTQNQTGVEDEHSNLAYLVSREMETAPRTYELALASQDKRAWEDAIEMELAAHAANETWSEVARPEDAKLLTTKWVFDIKRDRLGNIERHKARLVVRGFEQRAGVDFLETFAPVARLESIRTLLALCAINKMTIVQFDISTAFLNGKIEEPVYIVTPEGVQTAPGRCLKLNKALYGLKQAPRAWNSTLNETLLGLGFQRTWSDMCVYVDKRTSTYLTIYVDDGLIMGCDEKRCRETIDALGKRFKLKELDGNFFLGIEIDRTDGMVTINQRRYTNDIIARFNLADSRPVSCPIFDYNGLVDADGPETDAPYREAVGCIQYLACVSRPDVLFAVNFLSQFNKRPLACHWEAVKRVIRYLKMTVDYSITYQGTKANVAAYCDADWGNDPRTRRSISGLVILLGGGPIIFASRKQPGVAQSSCEAEYVAACEAAKELKWLGQFLSELQAKLPRPDLYIDNESAIRQIESCETKRRCKHIDLRYHFVKLAHQEGLFETKKIDTLDQPADLLTKGLSGPQLKKLLENINMRRRGSPIGLMPKLALLTTVLMCIQATSCTNSTTVEVELTGYTILVETPFQVARGVNVINFDAKFPDLCAVPNATDTDSVYDVKRESYNRYQGYCYDALKEVMQQLENLAACLPQPIFMRALTRIKRFFDPVTALVVVSVFAVIWAAKTTVEYLMPDSPANILGNNVARVNNLYRHLEQQHQESNTSNRMLKETSDRALMNEQALKQSASIHTELAWHTSATGLRLWDIKEGLKGIGESCSERRLNVNGLGRFVPLTKIPELNGAREKDTTLQRLEVVGNDTLSLTVNVNVIDPRSGVFEVVGLSHWRNYTTKPVWVEYQGPQYVLVNSTNNCQRGIDKPVGSQVTFETCLEENYRDPLLDYYTPAANQDTAELRSEYKPTVYSLPQGNVIYCLYASVVINNRTLPCPPEPMKLEKSVDFRFGNISYDSRTIYASKVRGTTTVGTDRLLNVTSPEFVRTAEMWNTIKANHDESGKRLKVDPQTQTVAVNMSFVEWAMTGLGCLSSIITIGWCLGHFGKGGSGQGLSENKREEESHSEQINIINQVPEPQLHSQDDATYRVYLEALAKLNEFKNSQEGRRRPAAITRASQRRSFREPPVPPKISGAPIPCGFSDLKHTLRAGVNM